MADPDYVYDPDDWEYICEWSERDIVVDDVSGLRWPRDVKRFCTLMNGPDKFVARVPTSFDDDGEPEESEIRWFDSEAEARTACGLTPHMTEG